MPTGPASSSPPPFRDKDTVKQSIIQQMVLFGLAVELNYGGEGRHDGNYRQTAFASSVHTWRVKISSRRAPGYVLEDWHRATQMEHAAFQNDATVLADKYLRTLIGRVERVRNLGEGRTFTAWCKFMGVRPADLKGSAGGQEYWRHRFEEDCRVTRELAELLGGDDRVEELLSTTIR